MPTLLEEPGAAENPFADLVGGDNGGPAYQTVAGRFSEVPKADAVTPTALGAFADMVPGPGRDVEMPAVEQDLGIFQAYVPESPTKESEKALAEVPKPPDPKWIQFEKGMENATGQPYHQIANAIRVFGQSAGRYIFDGMQAFERGRADFYKNPTPEAYQLQGDQLQLPDGSRMSQEQENALEQKYRDELATHAPAAMANAAEIKRRSDLAEANTPIDPALADTIPARLARASGPVAVMTGESLIPVAGLPLMVMHGALATEQEALDAGATKEQSERAAVRSAIGLAIFGGASKIAAAAVAKVLPRLANNPSQLVRFVTQFVGQDAANETSSRAIQAWNAASDAPEGQKVQAAVGAATETNLENTVMNTMYAVAHAAKASKPKLKPPEAPRESPPEVPPEPPTSPASEPVEPTATTTQGTPETARYAGPASEATATETAPSSEVAPGPTSPATTDAPQVAGQPAAVSQESPPTRPQSEPTATEPEGNDWTTATQEAPAVEPTEAPPSKEKLERDISNLEYRMSQDRRRSIKRPEDIARLQELRQSLAGLEQPLPKLRRGEKQGDLLSNQTEDFALVGEKTKDYAAEADRAEAEAVAKEEARLQMEHEQGLLDDFQEHQARGGDELLAAIKSGGGLPAKSSAKHGAFAGELQNIREAYKNPNRKERIAYSDIFRKDAPDIDTLTQHLADRGFDVETPADTVALIEGRMREGRPVYGNEAKGTERHGMRLRERAGEAGYTDLIPDVVEFGRRVYRKGMTFAKWAGEMARHLGEKVKAHLKTVWDSITSGDERGGIGGLAGKGFGLKISGKRNDLNAATTARSTKLQKSFADSERAQKEINKAVPSERRQAAIAVNMEAGGDSTLLAKWEGMAKGKAFKQAAQDAQSLTPAEMAIRDKAKTAYSVLGTRGQKFGAIGEKLRDNYVTHVWDVSKKFSSIGSSKLKDKFKFSKARKFETFFDGDQAGFTPKTMALGKLLPAYMHELNSVIADRQFVQDVSSGVASDQRPLVIPKGNAKQVEAEEYVVSPVKKFQRSVYDTAAEAQAALQPGQIVTPRRASATHVNPRGFAKAVDAAGDPIDQSDYTVTDQHALSNWRWVNTDKAGNTTLLKSDLSVHPELAKRLNAMMGDSAIRRWYNEPSSGTASIPRAIAKGLDTAQSVMKREMFGLLAPFHQVQEGTHAIGHTVNPFFGIEDMSRPTPRHIDAMEHGLMLLPEKKGSSGYIEGVGGKNSFLSQAARKFGGKAGKMLADTIDGYQNYLFHQYIPGLKYKTYEHVLARNMERYASHIKSGEVTVGDVKMLSAEQANAAYGHLNYALLDRNPTVQHLMQLGLLAPDFLEARSRFVGQALRAPVSKAGHEQFRAIATIALVQAGAAYTLSKLLGDEWDPKHPFELTHNGRTYTMRSVPEDMARLFFSGPDTRREFVSARINPVVQKIDQLRTGKNYRGEQTGAWETMGELLANYIPITARQIPGLRTLTETGRNQTVTPLEQLAGSLGIKISRHSPITKVYQAAHDWKEAAGLPMDTGSYPVSRYQQLRYSLEDGDMERAKAEYKKLVDSGEKRDKITSGFRESILHAFTGSEANDVKFKKSLSPEDKQLYDLAIRKRHEILRRYQALRPSAVR